MAHCKLLATLLGLFLVAASAAPLPNELTPGQLADREALLAMKNAIAPNGFGTSKIKSWKMKGNPCLPKPWPHLTCWSGRVVAITLSNLNIQATLPANLRKMNELIELRLDGNRITGGIPVEWADPRFFLKLKTLDLHDNDLEGTLPNRKWNKKGAFKNLRYLDLSDNNFYGGLPDGWHSTNKVFKGLNLLDLSKNFLGRSGPSADSPLLATPANWCLATPSSVSPSSYKKLGWCPVEAPSASQIAMPNLKTLDLSDNHLHGELPTMWPVMFPNLRFFLLASNDLSAIGSLNQPAILPTSWTQASYPIAFPGLAELTLYPGNENICSMPNSTDNTLYGWSEINDEGTYAVVSLDEDTPYDKTNPFYCDSPGVDNIPQNVAITKDAAGAAGTKLIVSWNEPAQDATRVYGYKVTLRYEDVENEEFVLEKAWNGKFFKTYKVNFASPVGGLAYDAASKKYTLTTGYTFIQGVQYYAEVTAFNLDGFDSKPDASDAALPVDP